ncbi:hypothetical protein F511_31643 [Dorcoceras hygrometricum]|uniref:Uncharacterized protein n=1 Tax=Dorcoceras hygrometricum TaxID=472368 RepID=A0A2Z7A2L4_9LAMI|nr:hypothetical protein F511_31643 [Dorcoceras hygrometricum]
MGKAAMLRALQEEIEGGSSGVVAPSAKVAKKRKVSTPTEKEARRQKKKGASTFKARPAPTSETRRASTPLVRTREERPEPTLVIVIPKDALVVSPSGAVATGFICNMVPDRDISRLWGTTNSEAVGLFASQLASAMSWGGEVVKHITQAQREANDIRRHFDEMVEHCTQLEVRLTEVEDARAREKRAAERALTVEKEALEAEKRAMRTELDDTKSRAEEEIGHLRSEAANAWDLDKEEFLKSSEFDNLCGRGLWPTSGVVLKAAWLNFEPTATPRRSTPLRSSTFVVRAGRVFYAQVELPPEEVGLPLDEVPMRIGLKVSSWSGLCAQIGLPSEEVPMRIGLKVPSWSGLCAQVGLPPEKVPMRFVLKVPSWSGLGAQVEEPLEEVPMRIGLKVSSWSGLCAQIGLPSEEVPMRIGLKVSSRSSLFAQVGFPPEEVPMRFGLKVPSWSSLGAQVEEPLEEVVVKNIELREISYIP